MTLSAPKAINSMLNINNCIFPITIAKLLKSVAYDGDMSEKPTAKNSNIPNISFTIINPFYVLYHKSRIYFIEMYYQIFKTNFIIAMLSFI